MKQHHHIEGSVKTHRGSLAMFASALVLLVGASLVDSNAQTAVPGTVVAWGNNFGGVVTNVPPGLTNVTAIAAGPGHAVALKRDGSVVAWGYNFYGQTNVPPGLSNVTAIAAGQDHTMALKSDGTDVAWGTYGWTLRKATVPAGLNGVTAISAGFSHSAALKNDGTVVMWDDQGQAIAVAGLSNATAISVAVFGLMALKSDGTVSGWGDDSAGNFGGRWRMSALGYKQQKRCCGECGPYHCEACLFARNVGQSRACALQDCNFNNPRRTHADIGEHFSTTL